jgi:hypothetical protein
MREAWRFVSSHFGSILGLVGLLWGSMWSSIGPLGAIMASNWAHRGSTKANKNGQKRTHANSETKNYDFGGLKGSMRVSKLQSKPTKF